MSKAISQEQLQNFQADLDKHEGHEVNERAVTKNGILSVSADYRSEVAMDRVFSIDIDTGKVADQKRSGRCWMFAALNTMRHSMREKLHMKDDFELSQNYTFFWDKLEKSNRVIKITSRGGSQIHRYIQSTHEENPYFAHWQDICKLLDGTGVSIAISLSLRAGSIVDDLDPLYLEEMNIAGDLIVQAQQYNIPVVVEGVGHVQVSHIPTLLDEIKKRCYDAPIKTLGPIVSDRMLSEEHINALIGGAIAAVSGASIIGVLFRSEHIGLPTVEDYEESLKNYAILKYALNLTSSQLELERTMSRCRASRQWSNILKYAFSPRSARDFFCQRHQGVAGTCTMCGERCALLDGFSADACDGVE